MINTARGRSVAGVEAILDGQKPCGNTFRLASRPLITAVLLATLTAGGQSAFGGADDSKSAVGSHQAPLADVHLHYVVAGHGPLLLVTSPGWGVGSLYLQRGLAPLEERFTLLYLDTRGSGGSTRPEDSEQMSTAVMADDIDRLRSYLGLDSINVLGHSNGSAIALDYAERYPQRASKVILIAPEVLDDRADDATQRLLTLWHDDPRYKNAIQALNDDSVDDSDEHFGTFLERILPLYLSDPDRYLPALEQTLKGTHLSSYASKAQTAADKLHPRSQSHDYVNIGAKVLIIQGTVDWACPVEVSERMHVAVPGSTLSLYANVGHLPWIEQPKRFFDEVALFLGGANLQSQH
jgi:proline iminopeptidase